MKKLLLLLLFATITSSCSKKFYPNTNGDQSVLGVINNKIKAGNANHKTPVFLENKELSSEELKLLNVFKGEDFTSIKVLAKSEAREAINPVIKRKVIQLIPFKDELLGPKYYNDIKNDVVINTIAFHNGQGTIGPFPLLILDGIPLRGEDIVNSINAKKIEDIESINLLKTDVAYKIYGIRAINGVLIITSKK